MAVASKTRNMLENFVREGSFKWLLGNQSPYDEELEEMERSPSARTNWVPELSPIANIVVRRCSKILGVPTTELCEGFNSEASESIKHPSCYARNFLEYCCFRALALSTQVTGHLADKKFRRLTYDMMIAWEAPAAASQPLLNVLASSSDGRLQFFTYDKYLSGLERAIRKMRSQSESSLLSAMRSSKREKVLEVDGTVTTQPVLEHVGISTWPGRLILTDHALYFEALRVVSYDKAKRYDLSDDLKQIVKPELTGPWGTRLFDKAVFYKSVSLSEPAIIEFPELKGHTRRDSWLAIIREILYVHRFIYKYQIKGIKKDEALSKAVLGILRLQAIKEISSQTDLRYESLLMFNLCDQLPGGDLILETMADMSTFKELNRSSSSKPGGGMYSISALDMISNLGFSFGTSSSSSVEAGLAVGEITVGEVTLLEKAVKESKNNYEKVVLVQATVDGVKVEGIDTNFAVMKELLFPMMELWTCLLSLALWEDPLKSLLFCCVFTYIICRGWLSYAFALTLVFIAVFMVLTRYFSQGKSTHEVKVLAPPAMNTMEQLLAVQNAISQAEGIIQDGNIVLLKLRALLLSLFPQASERFAIALLVMALALAFLPVKYIVLYIFLETFTCYSPVRRSSTERWTRRLREWWFSIPAAPVILEREKEEKKKK
ncbi:uncharacterized protein LOC126600350 isoform X4 [Malus sylvestris]|uniref:uncharacterized protein LOC126600350 isoform X4 n=1 Tax=Malus sylvestris TaxID=3752 RepID=UPI0021ACCDC8|nr:uncharacterized protein LOC126600350 isoform X4 [Malus sylvestris]